MKKLFTISLFALPLTLALTPASYAQQDKMAEKGQATGQCPDHFSALDSNKDQRITQKEERAVREKVFSSLDADKDSIVSREEYVKCLISTPAFSAAAVGQGGKSDKTQVNASFLGISERRSEQQFKQVDSNGDGKVSWSEYMNAAKNESAKSNRSNDRTAPASAGWAFARMDSNLSGDLTMQEWTQLSDPKTFAETSFKAIDQNSDGKISKQEYQAMTDKRFKNSQNNAASGNSASQQQASGQDGLDFWNYEHWF